jgi:hypothetical protein
MMADAVCGDIGRYGAEQVAVLVVSHTDAEDLADRVRVRLAATGALVGPAIVGPGWTAEREYRAGDRVLLHARCGPSGRQLVNGATATVTAVNSDGLTVLLNGRGKAMSLPAAFVQGARKDGSPNLSHAWARTVDGAQGGTWEVCHLLGSAALDAYRGYTGQSRSRQPTHTWNTARVAVVDHGGALADRRDAAEQVADALARQPDPSLAARSDPWPLDSQLRQQIAEHERVLAARPPDRRAALGAATKDLQAAKSGLADREAMASRTADRLAAVGALAGLTRRGRDQRRWLQDKLASDAGRAAAAKDNCDELGRRISGLRREQDTFDRFEAAEGWRRDDISHLWGQLDHHWAEVVAACVQADDPLAYGVERLRHARATTVGDLRGVDTRAPVDRAAEHDDAGQQLADAQRARQQAEEAVDSARAAFDQSRRRRRGRTDQSAVATAKAGVVFAEQRLERAVGAEGELRERFASLARHQLDRHHATSAADGGANSSWRPRPCAGRRTAAPPGRTARASTGLTRRSRRVVPPRAWNRSGPRPQRRLGRAVQRSERGHWTSPAGDRHCRPAVALQRRRGRPGWLGRARRPGRCPSQ